MPNVIQSSLIVSRDHFRMILLMTHVKSGQLGLKALTQIPTLYPFFFYALIRHCHIPTPVRAQLDKGFSTKISDLVSCQGSWQNADSQINQLPVNLFDQRFQTFNRRSNISQETHHKIAATHIEFSCK